MAVPKQRHTKSRRNRRRMHIYLEKPVFAICSKCGKPTRLHTVCLNCGYYKGREEINILEKLTKKEKKQREKEIAAKEVEASKEGKKGKALSWEEMSRK